VHPANCKIQSIADRVLFFCRSATAGGASFPKYVQATFARRSLGWVNSRITTPIGHPATLVPDDELVVAPFGPRALTGSSALGAWGSFTNSDEYELRVCITSKESMEE
jgi:hypothetical protein